jgi:hypothetical protein
MRLPLCAARPLLGLVLLLAACGGEGAVEPPPPPKVPESVKADRCQGRCSETQLCVQDRGGEYGCAMICANQFHCWSGCCLAFGDSGYNVCRPNDYCFAR